MKTRSLVMMGMLLCTPLGCDDGTLDLDEGADGSAEGAAGSDNTRGGSADSPDGGSTSSGEAARGGEGGASGEAAGEGGSSGEGGGAGGGDGAGEGGSSGEGGSDEIALARPVPASECGDPCPDGQVCGLVEVQCFAPPCNPVPGCVANRLVDRDPCLAALCSEGSQCRARGQSAYCVPVESDRGGEGVSCGDTTCPQGQVCCNDSCGICTPPDGFCTQQFCTAEI